MKRIIVLLCIAQGAYAQTTVLDTYTLKTYTIEDVSPTPVNKSYVITDQTTLDYKRVNVNKVNDNLYTIESSDNVKPKSINPYKDVDYGYKKSKQEMDKNSTWFESQLKKKKDE